MCPFTVRVPSRWSLADFLGSMVTLAVRTPRVASGTLGFRLGGRACLPPSAPTAFNRPFRRAAEVSLLRLRIARNGSHGFLTVSSIGWPFRGRLRSRLTLGRLASPRKPWSCGGGVFRPPCRYLYLHLLFHTLQGGSRRPFHAEWNAPLPRLMYPAASVCSFIPDYYPRRTPRLVSCYALFK